MLVAVDVQLAAPPGSEDRLRSYYVGVLGMTEAPKPPRRLLVPSRYGGCALLAPPGRVRPNLRPENRTNSCTRLGRG